MANKATLKTIRIIEYLAGTTIGSLSQIAKALSIPKTSCYDILQALIESDFVEYADDACKTYRLSIKAYQIGCSVVRENQINSIAHEVITKMSEKLNETCYFVVENHGKIIYIDKVESDCPLRSTCNVGSSNDMYSTGLGKAILAAKSDSEISMYIKFHELIAKTPYTITTGEKLFEDIYRIRERGYSIDNCEGMEHIKCVAAPLRNRNNEIAGAISVASLKDNLTDERIPEVSKLVIESAFEISRRLGFNGESLV